MRRWFVSRQDYWGEENPLAVEIAAGGIDYANADMLGVSPSRLRERGAIGTTSEAFAAALVRHAQRARVASSVDGEARRTGQLRPPPSTRDASRRNRLLKAAS